MAVVACSGNRAPAPQPQWVVYVATDAPVPGLGEQLALEIVDESGNLVSPDSRRLFDGSRPSAWPLSFGVLRGSAGDTPRIHVQLYRLDEVGIATGPVGAAFLDATARLPPTSGVTTVALELRMSCFSVPADLAGQMSCDPSTSTLAPEATLAPDPDLGALPTPGSWPPAQRVDCRGQVPPGMACIPGGVFLLGAVRYAPTGGTDDPSPQHLVQLSPFALDVEEMTVGQARALVKGSGLFPPAVGDFSNFDSQSGPCTYLGADDASHDAYPINCIDWPNARAACMLLGKRLPTEAEWEYAAGNLDQKTRYPWGSDTDFCEHAILARGRPSQEQESHDCLVNIDGVISAPGPVPGGDPADVTELGVRDLGGNVAEWLQDFSGPYDGPCWNGASLLVDPVCAMASYGQHSLRGGSWSLSSIGATTTLRDAALNGGIDIGVRCAVSM
jgi:sulfatase modifying factor 1